MARSTTPRLRILRSLAVDGVEVVFDVVVVGACVVVVVDTVVIVALVTSSVV